MEARFLQPNLTFLRLVLTRTLGPQIHLNPIDEVKTEEMSRLRPLAHELPTQHAIAIAGGLAGDSPTTRPMTLPELASTPSRNLWSRVRPESPPPAQPHRVPRIEYLGLCGQAMCKWASYMRCQGRLWRRSSQKWSRRSNLGLPSLSPLEAPDTGKTSPTCTCAHLSQLLPYTLWT